MVSINFNKDLGGNISIGSAMVTITTQTDSLALEGDLDSDGILNNADIDIDGDGIQNLDDRTAYDDGSAGVLTFSENKSIVLDFAGLPDGATPFQGGFTGLAQTSNASPELDYSTNAPVGGTIPASVINGKLQITSTNDNTLNADSGFTFLADNEGKSFIFEGVFDNPAFNGAPLPNFSQYGLILSLTGAPGVTSANFVKLTTGNPGAALELSGSSTYGSVPKLGYPDSFDSTSYAQVKLTFEGTVENGLVFLTGKALYLNENGNTLFELTTIPLSIGSTTPLYSSLTETSGAPDVAFGLTSTDVGAGGSFTFGVESLSLSKPEMVVEPPSGPDFGLEVLESLDAGDGIATGGVYTGGEVGSVELSVMANNNNVQSSNFGAGSFQLTNTGDKKIAAVFIDFRDAVFGDSVIDFDGTGGDTAFKKFVVDGGGTDATTGAFFDQNDNNVYYLPGESPLPNNTSTGVPSSGGFRGLLLKAGNAANGFEPNETVGFSGDMDPNSVAGLPKSGIDSGAINSWDVGGISGAEIAGSRFFVLFDDGTTAFGVLANNGTQAGSVGQAVQGQTEVPVNVIVNNGSGTYGENGNEPNIVVTGPAGQTVKVVLAKGLQPVTNDNNGYEQLVEARLAQSQPEFQVNNAFDFQEVIVIIGQNGTVTLPAGAFNYSNTESGVQFAGDNVAPIAISAVAVNGDGLAIGPVDREYLTNPTQTPVVPVEPESPGYFEVAGSGNNQYFKIQIEDAAALNGGTSPNGNWNYVTAPDNEGRQTGFQGSGYYVYGSNTSTAINPVNENEILEFEIEVPQSLAGQTMTFRARASRDALAASDQQNDIWINVIHKDGTGSIEEFLVETLDEAKPVRKEFIKVVGGPNNGTWGYAKNVDGFPGNFPAQIAFPEAGRYILQVAGRSQGFHIDFIELFAGSLGPSASNSTFVPTGPQPVQFLNEIPDQVFTGGVTDIFDLPSGTFFDPNGDPITYQIAVKAANGSNVSGVTINETTGQISGLSTLAIDTYQVTITGTDADGAAADTFEIDIVDEITLETLVIPVSLASDDYEQFGGGNSSDLELGLNGGQQEVGIRFAGITIPDGAEITNAFIQFTAFKSNADPASFTIGIQDSENAATFTSTANLLGRTTAAELSWSDVEAVTVGQTYNTPNLAPLVQQVIGADGVTDGALAFLINGTTATSSRTAQTFGNGTPAELVIEFGPTSPPAPEVSITATQDGEEEGSVPGEFTVNISQAVNSDTVISYSVGGTATADVDYNALSGSVTIPANQQSTPIDVTVLDDELEEEAEELTVTLDSITAGEANLLLSANDMATITIVDDEQPLETVLLEAEAADKIFNYRIENIGAASGGVVLSFVGEASSETGSAAFTFNGASGNYNVMLGTFDESDGEAQFTVEFTDVEISPPTASVSIVLDASLGSNLANASTFVELPVTTDISLTPGDILTVNGFEDGNEHARLDYLKFVPTV